MTLMPDGSSVQSEWVIAGLAVTAMVLTQAMGIPLEALLVKSRLFFGCRSVRVPEDFGPATETEIDAYEEYDRLYILLAQLVEDEDVIGRQIARRWGTPPAENLRERLFRRPKRYSEHALDTAPGRSLKSGCVERQLGQVDVQTV